MTFSLRFCAVATTRSSSTTSGVLRLPSASASWAIAVVARPMQHRVTVEARIERFIGLRMWRALRNQERGQAGRTTAVHGGNHRGGGRTRALSKPRRVGTSVRGGGVGE